MKPTRASSISDEVRNLKEFGYPFVSPNTMTDSVYSAFFASMMGNHPQIPEAVELLDEVNINAILKKPRGSK